MWYSSCWERCQPFSQPSGTSPELPSEALSRAPILPSASEASTSAEVSPKSLPNIKTTAQPVAEILAVAQVQKSEPAILFYMNRNLFRPIIYFKTGDVMLTTTDLLLLWTSLARLRIRPVPMGSSAQFPLQNVDHYCWPSPYIRRQILLQIPKIEFGLLSRMESKGNYIKSGNLYGDYISNVLTTSTTSNGERKSMMATRYHNRPFRYTG